MLVAAAAATRDSEIPKQELLRTSGKTGDMVRGTDEAVFGSLRSWVFPAAKEAE